ncbi:GGDEF domain-containing protein [Kineosporia sp. NBRC 101731]|uniref:GGDEF domain-containing protein n=1 Tax=Kineosporia sp. NBRC 101731 TaxID=3032199 RepID=UPI0024A1BE9F|nr:GGDEF domain-containing protein [Kineosporia sp. NBRC 101731]GLY29315.1 hypothetical protein Kisp02_26800 [Kineosporia sp. NBRC 101731]
MLKLAARSPGLFLLGVVTVVGVPLATLPGYADPISATAYFVVFCLCQVLTVLAVRRIPGRHRGPWSLMLVTSLMWFLGEAYTLGIILRGDEAWPTPADGGYLIAYVVMALAVLRLDREEARHLRSGSLLDATIVTLSAATLTVVFLVQPLVTDGTQSILVRVVSSVYPLIDVLLVYLVARLLASGRTRTPSLVWLAVAMVCTLVADTVMNLQSLAGDFLHYPRLLNLLWLMFYLCVAFAALEAGRPVKALPGPRPRADGGAHRGTAGDLGVARLAVLALAAMLPSLVIVTYGWWGGGSLTSSAQLGAGSVVLISLVAARIWGLIRQLRSQARQLDELAATDQLTTVANRRTWDAELARLVRPGEAAPEGAVLVALLDLDHFKRFNDSFGHQAGDDLLRSTAAAWQRALRADGSDGLLARWGGEEFGVILRVDDERRGLAVLDGLRAVVTDGQTVSIGVSVWDGKAGPDDLMHAVDRALYQAKHGGRDRLVLAAPLNPEPALEQAPEPPPEQATALTSSVPGRVPVPQGRSGVRSPGTR